MTKGRFGIRFGKDRGLWEVDYRDDNGRRRRPLFPAEADALAHAAAVRKQLGRSLAVVADREVTIRDFAAG